MKMIMIVLAIRFVIALLDMKIKDKKTNVDEKLERGVQHPAENQLR